MANAHGAAGIDGKLLHEAEADDVFPQVGVDDDAKGLRDGGLDLDSRGSSPAYPPTRVADKKVPPVREFGQGSLEIPGQFR